MSATFSYPKLKGTLSNPKRQEVFSNPKRQRGRDFCGFSKACLADAAGDLGPDPLAVQNADCQRMLAKWPETSKTGSRLPV